MKYSIYILLIYLSLAFISCEKETHTPLPPQGVGNESISLIQDRIQGKEIILAGSGKKEMVVAFERTLNGRMRSFKPLQGQLPAIMEDSSGNVYDLFGYVISGPETGENLKVLNSGIGFWFSFAAAFPGIELYQEGGENVSFTADTSSPWTIATNVMARGASFDAIPSLDDPKTITYNAREENPDETFFLSNEDFVIWVSINGDAKAYPHKILDWHEIVNDELNGVPIAVSYCPLTGTAKVWKRPPTDPENFYAVSGLLYNSNLIAYSKGTDSYWPQILARSAYGNGSFEKAELIPHVEMRWQQLLLMEQNPKILSNETGYNRDYEKYPYGDYKQSSRISYPVFYEDNRLHSKERVFCIIVDGTAKVYRYNDF